MKIQLQGQTLRLRVDESELDALLAGRAVSNLTPLPGIGYSEQVIELHDGAIVLVGSHAAWRAQLPRAQVQAYVRTLPARKGLEFALASAARPADRLLLVFEVDVRDSVRKRGRLPA
ncbi:MAG: hypothetical protein QM581_05545 [Pseudomonas sp.]